LLEHGGGLLRAAQKYSISVDNWLDLSTGVNPVGWPVPKIPAKCWQRLPEQNDGLIEMAGDYYGCQNVLPVAGSQAAIQVLPKLRQPCRVAVPIVGYAEHRQAWEQNGHDVIELDTESMINQVSDLDVVVVINPNNPTGEWIEKNHLLDLYKKLQAKDGWMIVDEAFMDMTPKQSLSEYCPLPGLFVLRSVGKFFGLAGIRTGFVLAEQTMLDKIEQQLGPWAVTGATRWITSKALADKQWQKKMRQKLQKQSTRLKNLIEATLGVSVRGTALFQTCLIDNATEQYEKLAKQGVLVRLLDQKDGLRFGLPAGEAGFERLEKALSN
jgi:L-threonine-O-3-phosphate decarboxylase